MVLALKASDLQLWIGREERSDRDRGGDSWGDNSLLVWSETTTGRQRDSGASGHLAHTCSCWDYDTRLHRPLEVWTGEWSDLIRTIGDCVDCIWASLTSTNVCRVDINNTTVMSR